MPSAAKCSRSKYGAIARCIGNIMNMAVIHPALYEAPKVQRCSDSYPAQPHITVKRLEQTTSLIGGARRCTAESCSVGPRQGPEPPANRPWRCRVRHTSAQLELPYGNLESASNAIRMRLPSTPGRRQTMFHATDVTFHESLLVSVYKRRFILAF